MRWQKRFLLLLSSTPYRNSLGGAVQPLDPAKPGIFKTEKEFRASYMTSANRACRLIVIVCAI